MGIRKCEMRSNILITIIVILNLFWSVSCNDGNGQPNPDFIVNGEFETGDLTGWTQSGIDGGFATVEEEGNCFFSVNNTSGIAMKGIFAANVRSSDPAPINSIGILTSDTFLAGSAIRFIALSENDDNGLVPNPVTFEVRILDDSYSILLSEIIETNIVTLSLSNHPECTAGDIRDGAFSTHVIDTSAIAGEAIRIEFRQHTNVPGSGYFTLIDEVEVLN